jgi:hypothetical protein
MRSVIKIFHSRNFLANGTTSLLTSSSKWCAVRYVLHCDTQTRGLHNSDSEKDVLLEHENNGAHR